MDYFRIYFDFAPFIQWSRDKLVSNRCRTVRARFRSCQSLRIIIIDSNWLIQIKLQAFCINSFGTRSIWFRKRWWINHYSVRCRAGRQETADWQLPYCAPRARFRFSGWLLLRGDDGGWAAQLSCHLVSKDFFLFGGASRKKNQFMQIFAICDSFLRRKKRRMAWLQQLPGGKRIELRGNTIMIMTLNYM